MWHVLHLVLRLPLSGRVHNCGLAVMVLCCARCAQSHHMHFCPADLRCLRTLIGLAAVWLLRCGDASGRPSRGVRTLCFRGQAVQACPVLASAAAVEWRCSDVHHHTHLQQAVLGDVAWAGHCAAPELRDAGKGRLQGAWALRFRAQSNLRCALLSL